jgi:hypothetical protein
MVMHWRLLDSVRISVFGLRDIDALSYYFLGKVTARHARDKSIGEYATSPILAQLSVQDCDETMLRSICNLYGVDVAMMKHLGFELRYCD